LFAFGVNDDSCKEGVLEGPVLAANEVLLVAAINGGFIDGSSIDGMLHSVMRAEDEEAIAQAANEVLPVATDAWSPGGG